MLLVANLCHANLIFGLELAKFKIGKLSVILAKKWCLQSWHHMS
jgi:hypothetical protein